MHTVVDYHANVIGNRKIPYAPCVYLQVLPSEKDDILPASVVEYLVLSQHDGYLVVPPHCQLPLRGPEHLGSPLKPEDGPLQVLTQLSRPHDPPAQRRHVVGNGRGLVLLLVQPLDLVHLKEEHVEGDRVLGVDGVLQALQFK